MSIIYCYKTKNLNSVLKQRLIQDFPTGANPRGGIPDYYLDKLQRKLHKNEENGTWGSTILHIFALGCALFPDFIKNSSERQILWSLCSVDFHALTLQLPIQTLHSVAPELQVFVNSLENHQNFSKMSTPLLHKFACRTEKFLRWLACQSSEMRSCLS